MAVFNFFILFFGSMFFQPSAFAATTVDKIIAAVGTEVVLQSDLDSLSGRLKKDGSIDETLLLGEPLVKLKSDKAQQLQYLVREKIVESEIKRLNLEFTEDRVNQEIDSLAKRNQMSRADLDAFIKKQGFTVSEYKKTFKARMERQSFFESQIVSKLRITDEDAYNEYKNKNPNYKPNTNEYKLAQIFFDPRKGSADEAQKRAETIYKKIQSGEKFSDLANKYSEDRGANADGFLGQLKTGEFNSDIERAVSGLDAGDTSLIVRTKQGFHIFKVLDKKVSHDPLFLKYKEQIKASLVEKNFKRQLKNWFESKTQDTYIKIYE